MRWIPRIRGARMMVIDLRAALNIRDMRRYSLGKYPALRSRIAIAMRNKKRTQQ